MSTYAEKVLEEAKKKNVSEPEFLQTVEEVSSSPAPVVDAHSEYGKTGLLERMVELERTIELHVVWVDDAGKADVNRDHRVQYNEAIGLYEGGLYFVPSVTLSVIKSLGFEQTFKNSLTTLPMDGVKGGSGFGPRGKSDAEIMHSCRSFMTELCRHIGPDADVPAGDSGVGGREVAYVYGQCRHIHGTFESGVITGKDHSFGGGLIRLEATGYSAIYHVNEIPKYENDSIKGRTSTVSGSGNVTWDAMKKIAKLGDKVVIISGPDDYVYDPDGVVTNEKINFMLDIRSSGRDKVQDYTDKFGVELFPGERPQGRRTNIALPCVMQSDISMGEARKIAANGIKCYTRVINTSTINGTLIYLMGQKDMIVALSRVINAGDVAVSGLGMSQNSERLSWTGEEADQELHQIMKSIYGTSVAAAEGFGLGHNLIAGADIAGFKKIADAMLAQDVF